MAAFHCLGEIQHYIRQGANASWSYLGTAETSPLIETTEGLLPVFNDVGGRTFPTDYVRDRRQEVVTTTLNRFNWTTYNRLRLTSPPNGGSPANYVDALGEHGVGTIGVYDFQLLLAFAYGGTPALAGSLDAPRGRLYFSAIPRKFSESSVGNRVVSLSILFECNGVFDPVSRNFPLYTENAAAFGAFVPE